MEVIVTQPEELDRRGADIVAGWLGPRPGGAILPALGTSALGVYRELAALRDAGGLDTSELRLVQLDEYVGLEPGDPRSLRGWLERDVAVPLGIPRERVVDLPSDPPDVAAACRAYDAAVVGLGGIDVAVLGLGPNGHLGFNEPPSGPTAPTRRIALSEASIESNAAYWGTRAAVPTHALTAGMDVVLAARRSLLVVVGSGKVAILRRLITELPSDDLPASHLRQVPGAVLLADMAAWPPDVPVPADLAG